VLPGMECGWHWRAEKQDPWRLERAFQSLARLAVPYSRY
jgi:hypothetical protein